MCVRYQLRYWLRTVQFRTDKSVSNVYPIAIGPPANFIQNLKRVRTAMKKTLMWCFIGLLSLGSVAWSQAQTTGGTEKTVAALAKQKLKLQKTNNAELVTPL